MRRLALFAFHGDPNRFGHLVLNAIDMVARGHEVQIVIEGRATRLVKEFRDDPSMPHAGLFQRAVAEGLVSCVCATCAEEHSSAKAAKILGIEARGEMGGHPSVGAYLDAGFDVLVF